MSVSAVARQRLDISRALRPVIRSIGLTRIARGAGLGFAAGALAGAALLMAAHIWSIGPARPAVLLLPIVGTLAGLVWGITRWPREGEAARAADLYFGLDDRLTTAVELRNLNSAVAYVQSRDTAQRIDGLALGRSRGRWLRRHEVAGVFLAVLLFAAGLALGPPARAHHAPSGAAATAHTRKVTRTAAGRIRKLQAQVRFGLTPAQQQTPAMRKLSLALTRLRRHLLKAGSTRASLRSISATQQQLRSLAASLHPISSHAVAQLNGSLAHQLGQKSGGVGKRSRARSASATAAALSRLARALAHLSPSQRAALARALARAANANSNTGLRSALRQAASSLAGNSPQAARSALQRAARSLSQSAGTQAAQSRALSTASQLTALKSAVSNAGAALPAGQAGHLPGGAQSPGRSGQSAGKSGQNGTRGVTPGQGKGSQGKGTGNGKGLGQGKGQGTRAGAGRPPNGARTGQGNGTGRRLGTGAGNGRNASGKGTRRSGGHGKGGRGTSSATRAGHTVTVYVPGKQGRGQIIIKNGPSGAPASGALVPYQQVLGQYSRQAHQALDRGSLPPSVQSYVHRYFSTISH
jgi:hypothetical protein